MVRSCPPKDLYVKPSNLQCLWPHPISRTWHPAVLTVLAWTIFVALGVFRVPDHGYVNQRTKIPHPRHAVEVLGFHVICANVSRGEDQSRSQQPLKLSLRSKLGYRFSIQTLRFTLWIQSQHLVEIFTKRSECCTSLFKTVLASMSLILHNNGW
jgi:hypothetical protein